MKQKRNILLTGVTGFLGAHLFQLMIKEKNNNVFVLMRSKNGVVAEQRLSSLVADYLKRKDISRRVQVIHGDITKKNLGINPKHFNFLYGNINEIYHCAANTQFRGPLEIMRKINVEGTRNILNFSTKCHKLKKINYVSTVFIVGNSGGVFSEDYKI